MMGWIRSLFGERSDQWVTLPQPGPPAHWPNCEKPGCMCSTCGPWNQRVQANGKPCINRGRYGLCPWYCKSEGEYVAYGGVSPMDAYDHWNMDRDRWVGQHEAHAR